jgi:ribonuclease E
MTKRMLISADEEESRVAIIEDTVLENLEIEVHGTSESRRGNIYKGIVHKVEPSLQAAFIDFGDRKQGFLPVSEIHPRLWPKNVTDKRPDISLLLREKQELMVQVVKDEVGTKGATLTTHVSLPGRYLVLMPESDKTGISRRLTDVERKRLKETVDSIGVPDEFGVIIRTAGKQRRPLELKKDLLYLVKLYETIEEKFAEQGPSGLIYRDRNHAVRFIRDYFDDNVEEIWVNHRGVLKEIAEFMSILMPAAQSRLRLYEGDSPLFLRFGVEDQIESIFSRQVELPTGGSIVIDSTEALVAIDVNSGRVKGEDIEETALMTNLSASGEIARQIILRDLGGLIVLDYIDMRDKKNNRAVEQRLRQAFADDKAKLKFGRISEFGLMELSRQRLRKSLVSSVTRRCDACDGTGRVRSPSSSALSLLRRIKEACLRGGVKYIRATTPISMANLLHNRRRRDMVELEQKLDVVVEVVGHKDLPPNLVALDIVVMKPGKKQPQRIYQLLDLIRNQVIRNDTSPLPKPEDGLEALEFDHTAIYRAISDRDTILQEEEAAREEKDFAFAPMEPSDEDLKPKPKGKVIAPGSKESWESSPQADDATKGGSFVSWMKNIFSGGESSTDSGQSKIEPITDEAVSAHEARRGSRSRSSRSRPRSGNAGRRSSGNRSTSGSRVRRSTTKSASENTRSTKEEASKASKSERKPRVSSKSSANAEASTRRPRRQRSRRTGPRTKSAAAGDESSSTGGNTKDTSKQSSTPPTPPPLPPSTD